MFSFSAVAASGFFTRHRCSSISIVRRQLFSTTQTGQIKKQQQPLLMLSSPKDPETRYFYELNNNGNGNGNGNGMIKIKLNRKIHLPEIGGHHCIGSSEDGFLATIDISSGKSTEIHITNPFTRQRIPHLPSLASLFDIDSSFYSRNNLPDDKYINAPAYPDLMPPLELNYTYLYRSRAILSQSFLFLLRDHLPPVFTPLSFDSSSSSSAQMQMQMLWSPHHVMFEGLDDYTFHKGRLHAVLANGVLVVTNLHNPFVTATVLPFQSGLEPVDYHRVLSLVESPDGNDLFLVARKMSGDKYLESRCSPRIDGWKRGPDSKEDYEFFQEYQLEWDEEEVRLTQSFHVFRLQHNAIKSEYKWDLVPTLGDLALFLGPNGGARSFSVSASNFPSLKPNCIYFTDIPDLTWESFIKADRDGDTGVYNLEDGSIQLFNLTDATQQLNWPPPVWYMPPPPASSS